MNSAGWLAAADRLDQAAFLFVNRTLYWKPAADLTFWLANDLLLLCLLLAAGGAYAVWRGWRRALVTAVWGAAAVGLSSFVHNELFKPFFSRPRPFMTIPDLHLAANLRDLAAVSTAFPSTHSASAAALAVVVSGLDPALRMPAAGFVLAIGAGAVYSGGHYPLDVAAGYAVGLALGMLLRTPARSTQARILKNP